MNEAAPIAHDRVRPEIKGEGCDDAVLLKDVRFAWKRDEPDIVDVSAFRVRRGERVFIAGPSGSGKSTLLSLLGGIVHPRDGKVHVLGTDLAQLRGARRDRFRADHIGFVFQMFNLVPYLSMVDNVTLPCHFSKRRRQRVEAGGSSIGEQALRLLAHLELDRPGLSARSVTELSIGQQQRVAVARALIGAPEIVIADEPTSALDEGTREAFLRLLFAECLAEQTTLMFVSHDPRLGAMFDRKVALADLNLATKTAGAAQW